MGPFGYDDARKELDKKFKDKSRYKWIDRHEPAKKGKYTFIEMDYAEDGDGETAQSPIEVKDEEPRPMIESKLPIRTQRLVELIFNQTYFNSVLEGIGYNANKLPLGKLSKATLKQGFDHLNEVANLIRHPELAGTKYAVSQWEAINDFSNKYYSTIPHDFGRNRPIPINNQEILRKEISMLDTLADMEVANTIMKTTVDDNAGEVINMLDKRFQELKLSEMTPLEHKSTEYNALADYLNKSAGETHSVSYGLEDIFRIEREGEGDRFNTSEFSKLPKQDRRLLWHGSRATNFGGILSQGLRIAPPEAPVSGYAFGKGIYMADISSKSAQYCSSYESGGTGLLLLVEAELGKPMYEIPTGSYTAEEEAKQKGCLSTLGVGRTTLLGWTDGGFVHEQLKGVQLPDVNAGVGANKAANANGYLMYNEYIVYNVKQLRLRYLFRVRM